MRTDLYYEYGNIPVYRHYLTIGVTVVEVFPLNFLSSSLVDELERDQIFYRRKFNGTLTFPNWCAKNKEHNDWFLPPKDILGKYITELYYYGVGNLDSYGYWSSSELSSTEAYSLERPIGSLNESASNKSALLSVRPCRSFISNKTYYVRDKGPANGWIVNVIDNMDGTFTYCEVAPYDLLPSTYGTEGIGWSNITDIAIGTTDTAIGTGQANTTAIINQAGHTDSAAKLCNDFILPGSIYNVSDCDKILYNITKDGVYYWNGYFSITDGKLDFSRCTFEVSPLPNDDYENILSTQDVQYNIIQMPVGSVPIITTIAVKDGIGITYDRNRYLLDVIRYIASQLAPSATVSSEFFTNATNPVTLSANRLLYLTIAQKSDIIRYSSTDAAEVANISWKDLMDILWGMFQVKWDYNSTTNIINVEHISFWGGSDGLDLRNKLLSQGNNNYTYVKEKMPKYEQFHFMEALDDNFVGRSIWYNSFCVNQDSESNTKDISVNVTTDLEYILSTPSEITDDGFVILCNIISGDSYYVALETGSFHSYVKLNMHLSWANLHDKYFRHNRVLIEGYLNESLTTFWTAQKNIKQETNAIICPSDNYNADNKITTELGYDYLGDGTDPNNIKAKVERAELSPSGAMRFSLLYGPKDNPVTPLVIEKVIIITQYGDSYFVAVLSEQADAELEITIKHTIYESNHTTVFCEDTVGQIWTIHTGEILSNFDITICDLIPIGGCIYFDFTYSFVNWSVRLTLDPLYQC